MFLQDTLPGVCSWSTAAPRGEARSQGLCGHPDPRPQDSSSATSLLMCCAFPKVIRRKVRMSHTASASQSDTGFLTEAAWSRSESDIVSVTFLCHCITLRLWKSTSVSLSILSIGLFWKTWHGLKR